jgi:DNA gyrase/topoisomerase IV subunit A
MTWRSGLGAVDVAVLQALRQVGAKANRARVKTTRAVDAVDSATGLGPDLSYELLLSLGRTWILPIPLVDFQGNIGSPSEEPSAPRYNEVRLAEAGQLVAKVERTQAGAVPVGLINGDTHRGGSRPPFRPTAIVAALRRLQSNDGVSDEELLEIVGPPFFPGGCEIDGDLAALLAGEPGRFQLRAHVAIRAGSRTVEIRGLAPGVGGHQIMEAIKTVVDTPARSAGNPRLAARTFLPLKSLSDASSGRETIIECEPRDDADTDQVVAALRRLWPIETSRALQLPAALPRMLRAWPASPTSDAETLARLADLLG